MSQSKVIILNLKGLYNILLELKEFLKFEIIYRKSENELVKENGSSNHLIISDRKISNNTDTKNFIILNQLPLKILDLIEKINISLLKQKYSFQSNFEIKQYKIDLNSRIMSYQKKDLKLTERETEIILFLNTRKTPQSIDILQKEVWGYSENLETHTVETHIYRLRKKIKDTFKDDNFLISSKDGYKI